MTSACTLTTPLGVYVNTVPPPSLILPLGYSKIYRYDVNIEPPVPPVPGNPTFASPKGYKIDLINGKRGLVPISDARSYS